MGTSVLRASNRAIFVARVTLDQKQDGIIAELKTHFDVDIESLLNRKNHLADMLNFNKKPNIQKVELFYIIQIPINE